MPDRTPRPPSRVLIVLGGPPNAGKTTIGRQLARRLARCAHVEVDALRRFLPWVDLEDSLDHNFAMASSVAGTLLDRGFHVVLTYPLRQQDLDAIVAPLAPVDLRAAVLAPDIDVARRRRGPRVLTPWEQERLPVLYHTHRIDDPGFGVRIDNSDHTPAETFAAVVDRLDLHPLLLDTEQTTAEDVVQRSSP